MPPRVAIQAPFIRRGTRRWSVAEAVHGAGRWARVLGLALAGLAACVGLWYLTSTLIGPKRLPEPMAVLRDATRRLTGSAQLEGLGLPPGGYTPHLVYTLINVVIGVMLGTAIGMLGALATLYWERMRRVGNVLLAVVGTVPVVILAPFLLVWFGAVPASQIVLVTLYSAIVLYIYTQRAAGNVPPKYSESSLLLGATERETFRRVVIPGAVPEVFGGLRIAFASAWSIEAVAELLGAERGVGRAIVALAGVFDITGVMALILLLGAIAIVLDGGIVLIRKWVTRWATTASNA